MTKPFWLMLLGLGVFVLGVIAVGALFMILRFRRKKQAASPLEQPTDPSPPIIPKTVTLPKCPQCQQPLPENAPEGLCPACLAKVALGSEPAKPGPTLNVSPLAEAAPPPRVAPDPVQLAAEFPQLEIIELLGMGGMGMVYKARQPRVDRLVALKILPVESSRGAGFGERFQREAKALAKLNHPGIVTFYDFGQTTDYYYFIMEYVDGMNLRHLLHNQPLESRQALELVTQICTALQYAHDEGVVHRDIKPENILLNKKGQVKIADFGLAKLLGNAPDTALTMSQAAMGTLNYMAPEQRQNAQAVDHRADIYSLGVVFYEMLTGEVPMGRFEAPSKRVQVDVRLDEVVLKALEREPARRYQQVSEVKTGVETITSTTPQAKKGAGAPEAFKSESPRTFVPFVAKWFMITAGAWLAVSLCLHWMLGDAQMITTLKDKVWSWSLGDWVVTFAPSESVPDSYTLLGACASCFYLGIAWIVLPAILILIIFTWLEARVRRGLKFRQLPPPLRRRYWWWMSALTGGYMIIAWGSVIVLNSFYHPKTITLREVQNLSDEATEWWFVPNSGAYEKLGLKATFAVSGENGTNDSMSWPACSVSLVVYHTNAVPAAMKVTLPGLRASYRFPVTNTWDYAFILDKDSLVEWFHKEAGVASSGSKFLEETGQIYSLLKAYQIQPPETVKEFLNLAKADLRDFGFGGFEGGSFSFGGFQGPSLTVLLFLLGGSALLYMVFTILVTRRLYGEAWVEINAGRWTPPMGGPAGPFRVEWVLKRSTLIWIVCGFFVALTCGIIGVIEDRTGTTLLILISLGIIIVVAFQLHSRQEIKEMRGRGLWPKLGDLPNLEQIKGLAQAGKKVLAIKLYREMHGVPLADAKAAVEKLAPQSPSSPPSSPPTAPGFPSTLRKTSNLIVSACLLGACAGLIPGISYTSSYWGLKFIYFQVPNSPMTVNGIESGSPAERTGFMLFDEIKAMDGQTNIHANSHQAESVVGEKHTYTVERNGKQVVLNAISTQPQLAALWYEDLMCPIAAALFICVGIVVFATGSLQPPPLWRSISVTTAGLVIAVALAIATGGASFSDRVAIYQRWPWLDTGKEWYFQQGLIGIAAAVVVIFLGATEIRKRLTRPSRATRP